MTKEIPITQGKVTIVGDDDFDKLMKFGWHAHKSVGGKFYAARSENGKTIYMHTQITGFAMTDHINGDGLDNRRENLRECNYSQNAMNKRMRSDNSSGFKGVHFDRNANKFQAHIRISGVDKHLGLFNTKREAAIAYNNAAVELYGEFAWLNEIKD